ncbi:putative Zn-dependent peptidase [Pontibacter ummariensis]|uniref:Predicted Zn-dependent peptidase n=1 Tax=Pontibacter ummariensis TaxID=1610492 RepID=A0A239HWA2_9BACT|nr:pitrilysin family protein [Pontibacter ummariensis]PRY10445.1 putative Zn-dependent peptidase [Pontibacter ummariensis]SNS84973.1 Predicted Zn-dependent peptidase [Pontibacter ummariensis]
MLDRTKAPETYEIDAVNLQVAEVAHLDNGARLHYIKSETQPVIRLDFVFKAGKWYEDKTGESDLAAKMLFEGTVNHTAKQIADKVAFYGASFENNHGYDRSEFTLYCLSKYVKELLPLVLDVLQHPTFPEEEFNLLKRRTLQNLKVQRQKNSYLATHSFTKQIYGGEHPYIFGFDEGSLEDLTKEDLEDFYKTRYNTQGLEIFVCGAVEEDLQRHLEEEVNQLQLTETARSNSSAKSVKFEGAAEREQLVLMADSLQSSIRIGKRFPRIGHEDYHKLKVLNEILGGYFGSRLMRNIREDKGYTYGIYSVISPKEKDSLFYIGTDVNYAVTENTISEVLKEIRQLQTEEVPEEELSTVKNYMLGKFLNDINTIFDQCDRYKRIVLFDLEQEHYNNFVTTVRTITAPELKQLAQQYLSVQEFYTSIAGRKE